MTRPRVRSFAWGILAGALIAVPGFVLAQSQPANPGAGKTGAGGASSGHDLIFFSNLRPLVLRFTVEVDGKSLTALRNDYVKRWFDYLDRDNNGTLDNEEARFVPRSQFLQQMVQGGAVFASTGSWASMNEVDTNSDGQVSLGELIQHFERSGFGALQQAPGAGNAFQFNTANEALFRFLDPKKAGKLTKERFAELANTLLQKLDADDDELVSLAELNAGAPAGVLGEPIKGGGGRIGPIAPAFYLVRPDPANQLSRSLLAVYDKDQNGKLSLEESGLRRSSFAQLDANEDGQLDPQELSRLPQQTPDLELSVRLGKENKIEVKSGKRPAPLASALASTPDGGLQLKVGDAHITFQRGERGTTFVRIAPQQFYVQQFRAADTKNRGFVNADDLQGPQNQLLRFLFVLMDVNRDAKLTLAEVQGFGELQMGAQNCFATLNIQDFGRGLFQLFDANHDNVLSLRELRTAWARLSPLDSNKDGSIAPEEIARQFQIALNPGAPNFGGRVVVFGPDGRPTLGGARPASIRGPTWFQRMDRNGDGDVSFREFLGTREAFDRIDTDGDGLIDAAEAQRHDESLRQGKKTR
jgi:Ca2+-binding EF-hand superfamily protein